MRYDLTKYPLLSQIAKDILVKIDNKTITKDVEGVFEFIVPALLDLNDRLEKLEKTPAQ